ncbi:MAG: hypothetical protein ABIG68_13540, partial [Acidobacteriota bacterium]
MAFENAFRGFGMSKHSSPLRIEAPHPRHGHLLPAVADTGRPAEPLMSDGMLFRDILKLFYFPSQIVENSRETADA